MLLPRCQLCLLSAALLFVSLAGGVSLKAATAAQDKVTNKPGLLGWGTGILNGVKETLEDLLEKSKTTPAPTTTRSNGIKLSAAQCEAALSQCSMRDVIKADYQDAWSRDLTRKEIFQYRTVLRQLKRTFVTLVDTIINDPTLTTVSLSGVCSNLQDPIVPRDGQQDDDSGDEDESKPEQTTTWKSRSPSAGTRQSKPTTASAPRTPAGTASSPQSTGSTPQTSSQSTTTAPSVCLLSEWSQWSSIVGFGQQQRSRALVQGSTCPPGTQFIETRGCSCVLRDPSGKNVFENIKVVSENFKNDFLQSTNRLPRDLMLVLDSSGSITDDDFQAMKEGVKALIDVLCGGFGSSNSSNRLSIILFSTDSVLSHSFAMDQSPGVLKQAVDALQHMRQFTCTGTALELAYKAFDSSFGSRGFTVHDTLLLTDGQSNCGRELVEASLQLQERSNVYSLAIGLGDNPSAATEIQSVVSSQDPRHLFSLANFRDFEVMIKSVLAQHDANNCQKLDITR